MRDNSREEKKRTNGDKDIVKLPIYNIRMMTDDEWNRMAYRNYLIRKEMIENG